MQDMRWCVVLAAVLSLGFAGCGTTRHASERSTSTPANRLVVLNQSIGPVRLGESRVALEKTLGRGTREPCGASYFGGRLLVGFCPKDTPVAYVAVISTRWAGFHTRSGLRVGASREKASSLPGMICGVGFCDEYIRPRHADGPLTDIRTRHRRVTAILIGYG